MDRVRGKRNNAYNAIRVDKPNPLKYEENSELTTFHPHTFSMFTFLLGRARCLSKMTERFVAACSLTLLVSPLPCSAQFQYTVASGAAKITGYDCPGTLVDLEIPDTLGGLPVTGIGRSAFAYCASIASVRFSTNVVTVEPFAFQFCTQLSRIDLPNSLVTLGDWCFFSCRSLGSAYIPDSVTELGGGAFASCGLSSVRLPSGLKVIGSTTFQYDYLTNIDFPPTLTAIGDHAFRFNRYLTHVVIPYGVTTIGDYAFDACVRMNSVILPASVTYLGKWAFGDSPLQAFYCQGSPPQYDFANPPFYFASPTVYYLRGTPGWSYLYAGVSTAEWTNPIVYQPVSLVGSSPAGDVIGFQAAWGQGGTVVVEASTNLAAPAWIPVSTNVLTTGTLSFSDSGSADSPRRYYRVRTK